MENVNIFNFVYNKSNDKKLDSITRARLEVRALLIENKLIKKISRKDYTFYVSLMNRSILASEKAVEECREFILWDSYNNSIEKDRNNY